jgi:integrase/recombinase XerD
MEEYQMKEELIVHILDRASEFISKENLIKLRNIYYEEVYEFDITKKCTALVPTTDLHSKLELYIACKRLEGLASSSLENYRRNLTLFFSAIQKDYKQINDMDARMYLAVQSNNHVSNVTLNNIMSPIRSFFKWLYELGHITEDPMKRIKTIKVEKRIRDPLSKDEIEAIRDNCKSTRNSTLAEVFLSTGCRLSEIQQLNKRDIDWENRSVKVFGKGSKERIVFLNSKSIYCLKKYLKSRSDNNEALFVGERKPHDRLGKRAIERAFSNMGKYADIQKNVFPHRLRNTCCTRFLANGAALHLVQDYLGHTDPKQTLMYTKVNKADVRYVYDKLMTN